MKKTLIVPLSKSPHPQGRIGPIMLQDWFQGLRRAVLIARLLPKTEILVLSNLKVSGQPHEADVYTEALTKLGAINIRVIRECYETIEQINRSFELAVEEKKDLMFISTFLHYLRVQWLIWRHPKNMRVSVKHCAVFGIPRPREALTDIILAFLFPFIDLFGVRRWFLKVVNQRRLSGKH